MEEPKHNDEAVLLPKTRSKGKGVASVQTSPNTPNVVTTKAIPVQPKWKKGIAILDFILRLGAAAAAFAATAIMGNAEQTLPFFTQFLQFHAEYNDLPTFTYNIIIMHFIIFNFTYVVNIFHVARDIVGFKVFSFFLLIS